VLGQIPDAQLTHYIEAVDLPAEAIQLLSVTGTHAATGAPVLVGMHLHLPRTALETLAQQETMAASTVFAAKRRAYNLTLSQADDLGATLADLNAFAGPVDTAIALVFQHPEIASLDPDLAAALHDLIQSLPCAADDTNCAPYLDTLSFWIATHWPATTTPSGWATLVPLTDANGTPVLDSTGKQIYLTDLTDGTVDAVGKVVRPILQYVFNAEQFKGSNWHPTQSLASISLDAGSGSASVEAGAAATGTLRLEAAHPKGTSLYGVDIVDLQVLDPVARTVQVKVRNHYLRCVSVYVQFFDQASNTPLPVDHPGFFDSPRAKLIGIAPTNDTIMGIPFFGDAIPVTTMEFAMPPQASLACVFFGSLGVGGNPFCPEARPGSIFTLGLNIGLPVIFMGVGVTLLEVQKGFQDLINNSVRDFTQAVAESATVRAMRSASLALAQKVPEMPCDS
jgi:hypothetical protein